MNNWIGRNIDKELTKLCKKYKVVGVNVALFNDKDIIHSYNYGYINKAANLKSTNDSLYMIGSNTKVMTALGILKLWENGKLSLDDDIRKFIPEFKVNASFEYYKITIENLLMHRSGLTCDLYDLLLDSTRDYHDVIKELQNTYLTTVPGQMFSYSNVGYTLLGIIIERISGITYAEYIQKVIGEPLGISIHFLENASEREPFSANISLCYNKKGIAVEDSLHTLLPAGSNTYISFNDFIKFGQMFLNKGNTIFNKETLELMEKLNVKNQIDKELMNVSYGLMHNQYDYGEHVGKVLGHGGNTTCHHSIFNYIPSLNIGVVVVTNSEQAPVLSQNLGVKILTDYLKSKELLNDNRNIQHKYTQANCDKYLGKFATQLGLLDIRKNRKGKLVAKVAKFAVKLVPCEDGYLQCSPNNLLLLVPPLKKLIKGIRIKSALYYDDEVLILEQANNYYKTTGIVGCRYAETTIPKSFADACGSYEISNKNLGNIACKCSLSIKDNTLKLELNALNSKFTSYLNVVDDSLAFTQGYGRNAKQSVELEKKGENIYLTYSGITFKKL